MGIITISRGSYSGGKEIAEKLSSRLGFECISREILLKASEDFNVPEVKLIQAIQDAPSFFDRFKNGKKKYVAFIRQSFLEHLQNDNIVYHGFAGHFFTKDIPNILKVRIIADINYRTAVIMKRENISKEKALKFIQKIDSERNKWSMYLYGMDPAAPELYDVVLRIDSLDVENAVGTLADLAKCACFQTTAESRKTLSDMLIAAKAHSFIIDDFPDANVKCKEGVVMVSLESPLSRESEISGRIKDLLRNIGGIKGVKVYLIPYET